MVNKGKQTIKYDQPRTVGDSTVPIPAANCKLQSSFSSDRLKPVAQKLNSTSPVFDGLGSLE